MARADSSPKAIIKAAIRNKCHVVAQRYPHQRLETLHGSNVKWLVLADELFDEVCSEFTIQKLELDQTAKRALFNAEWVPQVTYELITKPGRPKHKRAQIGSRSNSYSSATAADMDYEIYSREGRFERSTPRSSRVRPNTPRGRPTQPRPDVIGYGFGDPYLGSSEGFGAIHRHDSMAPAECTFWSEASWQPVLTSNMDAARRTRPRYFDTILN